MSLSVKNSCGGKSLPELTNPATESDIEKDKQVIDSNGNLLIGGILKTNEILTSDCLASVTENNELMLSYVGLPLKYIIEKGSNINLKYSLYEMGNAVASDVAAGKTFTSREGLKVTGTAKGGFPNGTEWTECYNANSSSQDDMYIYHEGGIWIAANGNTGFYNRYSLDGKTWTQSNMTANYDKLCYGNGIWHFYGGFNTNTFYYSTDGKMWNLTQLPFSSSYMSLKISYGGGTWICYNSNGINWTQCTTINIGCYHIIYDGGKWVAGSSSNKGIYYSTDGITWIQSNIESGSFSGIHYSDGMWHISNSSGNGVYYSVDGITWAQTNITSGSFSHYYKANGIWVTSKSGLYYSLDGITWTQSNITSGSFSYLKYSNGIWHALSTSDPRALFYSLDGIEWTQLSIPSVSYVHYSNRVWVLTVSSGGFYYSTDGINWTKSNVTGDRNVGCEPLNAEGIWVVGTTRGKLYYSVTWEPS